MIDVSTYRESSDVSSEYLASTALNTVNFDSASQCGNLADITRNSVFVVGGLAVISAPEVAEQSPSLVVDEEYAILATF